MRKTTSDLRAALNAIEQKDDGLAVKLAGIIAFIDKAERDRIERDEALKKAIDDDHAHFAGELRQLKAEIASAIAELRGGPIHIEAEAKQLAVAS